MTNIYLSFLLDKLVVVDKAIRKHPELSFFLKQIGKEIETIDKHIKNPTEFENESRLNFSKISFQFINTYALRIGERFPEFLELNPNVDWKEFETIAYLKFGEPVYNVARVKKELFPKIKHDFENLILPENVKESGIILKILFCLRMFWIQTLYKIAKYRNPAIK